MWLKGCEVCNAGLCARFDELVSNGLSQREAAKALEHEQIEQIGVVLYPSETLRTRYKRNKPSSKKMGSDEPKGKQDRDPVQKFFRDLRRVARNMGLTNARGLGAAILTFFELIKDDDPHLPEVLEKIGEYIEDRKSK